MDKLRVRFITDDLGVIDGALALIAACDNWHIIDFSHSAEIPADVSDIDFLVADEADRRRFERMLANRLYSAKLYDTDFLVLYTNFYADVWRHTLRLNLQQAPISLTRAESLSIVYATNGLSWLAEVAQSEFHYQRFNNLIASAKAKLLNKRRVALFY